MDGRLLRRGLWSQMARRPTSTQKLPATRLGRRSVSGPGLGGVGIRDMIDDMLFVMWLNALNIANTLKATKKEHHAVRYLRVRRGIFAIPFIAIVAILEEMHR